MLTKYYLSLGSVNLKKTKTNLLINSNYIKIKVSPTIRNDLSININKMYPYIKCENEIKLLFAMKER